MKNIHLHEKNQDTLTPKPEDTTVNRILAIIKYLNEETDPDTHIVPQRIADELKFCYGWNITRKTIAEYLKQMCSQDFNFGLECDSYKGNIKKYTYKRTFSFEQLSLLSDIICSSMFLDEIMVITEIPKFSDNLTKEQIESVLPWSDTILDYCKNQSKK